MKTKRFFLIGLLALTAVTIGQSAVADTINFRDTAIFWPGYPAMHDKYSPPDITQVTIGEPQVTGEEAEVDEGILASIGFFGEGHSIYDLVKPNDLFIDFGASGMWAYVLSLGQSSGLGYDDVLPLETASAYFTGNDNSGYWAGYKITSGNPYALSEPFVENGYRTFAFNSGIPARNTSIVGWTHPLNYGQGDQGDQGDSSPKKNSVAVPEANTLLLLGFGLISLWAFRARLKRK